MPLWVVLLVAAWVGHQPSLAGHWVNLDSADVHLFVLQFEPHGQVRQLMTPQFGTTYSVQAERVIIRHADGSVDSTYALRGDTLLRAGHAVMVRVSRTMPDTSGVSGTWIPLASRAAERFLEYFYTFRSDGQAVLEAAFPVHASLRGDTLELVARRGQRRLYTLRAAGDTLRVSDAAGRERRLVRRPWGCFGIATFDGPAVECH